jgi:pyruvate formate lyase activating enzyme
MVFSSPCGVGGCRCCSVLADGNAVLSCITRVREGMVIDTKAEIEPKRVVTGFEPHMVGGVGTPIGIRDYVSPVEVALFTHGCNFRCLQCQNRVIAFTEGMEMSPRQAAFMMSNARRVHRVHRMAFSGGECTLNWQWLIGAIKELRS